MLDTGTSRWLRNSPIGRHTLSSGRVEAGKEGPSGLGSGG